MNHIEQVILEFLRMGQYEKALQLTLQIPDITIGSESPRSDKITRYESFYNRYLKEKYGLDFMTPKDLFALYLEFTNNSGNTDISNNPYSESVIYFSFLPDHSRSMHCNKARTTLQLNTFIFCDDIIKGLNEWRNSKGEEHSLDTFLNKFEEPKVSIEKSLFISYSRKDEIFVKKLCRDLKLFGFQPFIDIWEIKVGDSITERIMTGMGKCKYFIPILSCNFFENSNWPEMELNNALMIQGEKKEKFILPLMLQQTELPILLKHIKYADFRKEYEIGLKELLNTLE